MDELRCRLCGSQRLALELTLERAPANISALLRPAQFARDLPVTLRVYRCATCALVQLGQFLPDDYYDDYVMTVSHSPLMQQFQREQVHQFVERFALHGKRVIEVGCGDGHYLSLLRQAGAEVVGLEPSRRFRALAAQRRLTVMEGRVGASAAVTGSPYDAFVARQVLEHVQDINDFLQGLRLLVEPGGVGLVEVPSLEKAFAHRRFYDFFPDHLNYFSLTTLAHALTRNGFDVLYLGHGMNGEFNVAQVRRAPESNFSAMREVLHETVASLHVFVAEHHRHGRRVAIWGAGGKGLTAMAVANLQGVAYVIDSDPHKQGLFTPVCHLPVVGPEQLHRDPVAVVIVTSLAYRDEVVLHLRQALNFQGTIAVLGEDGHAQ